MRPGNAPIRAALLLAVPVVAALVACAPERQPAGPRTEAPRLADGALVAGDGARLPLHAWRAQGPPLAVVLGVHGLNDYGNAFAIPAAAWTQAGVAVYAYDQRGFGGAGVPGVWAGATVLIDDLEDAAAALRRRHPALPIHIVGVSMGGAVTAAALADDKLRDIASAVLVAPAVWARETMPLPHRIALWLAARLAPSLRLSGRGLGIVPSDNVEMLRALGRDPLVLRETRADTLAGLADLMDRAWAGLAALPPDAAPVLLLYGAKDELIPRGATERAVCRMGAASGAASGAATRAAVYRDGYHMLLRDLGAATVHADVLSWIDDADAPLPSGAEAEARRFFSCPAPAAQMAIRAEMVSIAPSIATGAPP